MPNKKIDGIIKMSKEEMEKSRKIVLDSIEEELRAPKIEEKIADTGGYVKNVDSIIGRKVREKITDNSIIEKLKSKKTDNIPAKPSIPAEDPGREKTSEIEKNKIVDIKQRRKEQAEKARLKKIWEEEKDDVLGEIKREESIKEKVIPGKTFEKNKREENKEKEINRDKEKESLKKASKKEQAGAEKEKLKMKKEEAAKRAKIEKEKIRKNKIKERLELRRKKIKEKAKKKKRRKKRIREFKEKLIIFYNNFVNKFIAAGKRVMFYIVLLTVLFLFLYSLFAIILLKFNVDTKITRAIAKVLPVPAIITNGNVIEYYSYYDIRRNIEEGIGPRDQTRETVKLMIIKNLIINNLARKYNLSKTDNLINEINKKIVYDSDANFVSITRIMKIKKLIDNGEDFIRTSTRLGDSLGTLTISEDNKDEFEFYNKLLSLEEGENSDMIINADGYYIYHAFRKTDNTADLSYVKVNAKLLDKYISSSIGDYKMWSLVD